MNDQKIVLKKVRDLGGIFGATFGFIKRNFKTLFGSLLFFAGPFLLIAAVISANMFGSSLGFNRLFKGSMSSFYGEFIISYLIILLVTFIGLTVYNVILNKNLIENEKLNDGEKLTIQQTTINFFPDFWRVFGNTLLLILVGIVFIAVIALIFGGLFALAGGDGSNSAGVIVLLVIFFLCFFVLAIIFGPIISFIPMAAIFVCQRDGIAIFAAIKKVFYYMKGNFWNTWVVMVVGFLTYMVMGAIVQIPMFIVAIITAFSRIKVNNGSGMTEEGTSIVLVAVISICTLLSHGVRVVLNLMVLYQYNHLEEKKEGLSIIDKINQIQ